MLASALKEWLPDVLHDAQIWVSSHDIRAGVNWSGELATILSECQIGIAIVTPENQRSPWLLFEAGAVSRALEDGRVIPLLLDLEPSNVELPIAQFQTIQANRSGIQTLLETINGSAPTPLSHERLLKYLERWWPDLETAIAAALKPPPEQVALPARSDREVLGEILQAVRTISNTRQTADTDYLSLSVDSTLFFENQSGKISHLVVPESIRVSAFLDVIWSVLNEIGEVPPYMYGEIWVLQNKRTGEKYLDLVRDNFQGVDAKLLSISSLPLFDGDGMSVLKVEQKKSDEVHSAVESFQESPSGTRSVGANALDQLTPRQLEILQLLIEGLPNKLIARRLNISFSAHRGRNLE
jgi:hypothetical protein